jgi:hypothetical protein
MRASDLIGATAYDTHGRPHGRIADLLTTAGPDGTPYVYAALITPRYRGRLLGYERPDMRGPWIIERLVGLLHRGTREIPWTEIHLQPES